MTVTYDKKPSKEAMVIWAAFREAVAEELEKKRKLRHYAVFWDGEKPIWVGEDAPSK